MKNNQLVQSYFEGRGFERFRRIYGPEQSNRFQKEVRHGHLETVETVLGWLKTQPNLGQRSICDAGCGIGTLSIPLAETGAQVHAVDFSEKMIAVAESRAKEILGTAENLKFEVQDITCLKQGYDTVICIDLFARYSTQRVVHILHQLSSLADSQLILTFTPKTRLDKLLLKIGNTYAKQTNAPLLYTHRQEVIVKALEALGWEINRKKIISTRFKFYYCCLLEATRPAGSVLQEDLADLPNLPGVDLSQIQ
jgi:magnesium-protoporphyrin O-methyltransferase